MKGGPVSTFVLSNVVCPHYTPDIRLHNACAAAQQRSINLSISARGIYALESVLGTTETAAMLSDSIPMRGRMIHDEHGVQTSQTYDRHGRVSLPYAWRELADRGPQQTINSMDRAKMNALLLSRAAATPGVRVLFEHMVESIDYDRLTMVVRDVRGAHDIDVDFVLCVGADGCHSTVRRQLMRVLRWARPLTD
jgi:kynurenine 3-monooxygenase